MLESLCVQIEIITQNKTLYCSNDALYRHRCCVRVYRHRQWNICGLSVSAVCIVFCLLVWSEWALVNDWLAVAGKWHISESIRCDVGCISTFTSVCIDCLLQIYLRIRPIHVENKSEWVDNFIALTEVAEKCSGKGSAKKLWKNPSKRLWKNPEKKFYKTWFFYLTIFLIHLH